MSKSNRKLVTTTVRSKSSKAAANIRATFDGGMHTSALREVYMPEVAPVTIIIGGGTALPRPQSFEQKRKAHPQPKPAPVLTVAQQRKRLAAARKFERGNVAKLVGFARLAAASAAVPAVVKGKPVRVVQLSRKVGKRAKRAADDALVALAAALASEVNIFKRKRAKGAK